MTVLLTIELLIELIAVLLLITIVIDRYPDKTFRIVLLSPLITIILGVLAGLYALADYILN